MRLAKLQLPLIARQCRRPDAFVAIMRESLYDTKYPVGMADSAYLAIFISRKIHSMLWYISSMAAGFNLLAIWLRNATHIPHSLATTCGPQNPNGEARSARDVMIRTGSLWQSVSRPVEAESDRFPH